MFFFHTNPYILNVTVIFRLWHLCLQRTQWALQEELIAACRVKLFISYWSDFASSLFLYFKRNFFKAKYIIYGSKALTSFYHLRIPFGDDIKPPIGVLQTTSSCNAGREIALVLEICTKIYSRSLVCFHLLGKFATRG